MPGGLTLLPELAADGLLDVISPGSSPFWAIPNFRWRASSFCCSDISALVERRAGVCGADILGLYSVYVPSLPSS
jgi:hypothetical protein